MESKEEKVRTDIAEEDGSSPAKPGRRFWLYLGLGATLLTIVVAMMIMAMRRHKEGPGPSAADQEQQKYDVGQKERDLQKAARIRDDNYLVRKEDDNQAQLNSILKDLNMNKSPGADLPTPTADRQAAARTDSGTT